MGDKEMHLVAEMDRRAWEYSSAGRSDLANELWYWCGRFGDVLEGDEH